MTEIPGTRQQWWLHNILDILNIRVIVHFKIKMANFIFLQHKKLFNVNKRTIVLERGNLIYLRCSLNMQVESTLGLCMRVARGMQTCQVSYNLQMTYVRDSFRVFRIKHLKFTSFFFYFPLINHWLKLFLHTSLSSPQKRSE